MGAMKIIGTENLTREQVQYELSKGGKFVVYQYCVSLLVVSFKRSSDVYFVTANRPFTGAPLRYSLLSFIAGWWGVPWGPIWTIQSLWINLSGGRDVTAHVVAKLGAHA
jgi:hypothetical protein